MAIVIGLVAAVVTGNWWCIVYGIIAHFALNGFVYLLIHGGD